MNAPTGTAESLTLVTEMMLKKIEDEPLVYGYNRVQEFGDTEHRCTYSSAGQCQFCGCHRP